MNYKRIYNSLIDKRKCDVLSCENSERHHVIPKCMGGSNDQTNIVRLSFREHFVAHKLLTRIYPNNNLLFYSVYMMTLVQADKKRKPTSHQIAEARKYLKIAAKVRSKDFNPGKTEASRNSARKRMLTSNPISLNPHINHTAYPVIVEYIDGTIERFLCAAYIPIPYGTVKHIRRTGRPSKKHNILKIYPAD